MKIDSHQPFWHPSRGDYYWMEGEGAKPIRRHIGPAHLLPHLKAAGVNVQCRDGIAHPATQSHILIGEPAVARGVRRVDDHRQVRVQLQPRHRAEVERDRTSAEGRRDARAAAADMLQRVGLGQRLGHYPRLLSGGEQQRVALARAFVVQPKVLLADEPTGSLDHATGEKVMELMFELNREQGTTLVLVTHDRGIAARCDRQLLIDAGRLAAQGETLSV